ncbi:hypothetical protein MICRO8M_100169 [Microbacterium sp. 8M]|nr:hypothetical protein MICRO8M_100169 [Microbacterium sp. 8M]
MLCCRCARDDGIGRLCAHNRGFASFIDSHGTFRDAELDLDSHGHHASRLGRAGRGSIIAADLDHHGCGRGPGAARRQGVSRPGSERLVGPGQLPLGRILGG